mmetsp:Transcript_31716/g.66234  ORF Transcript_31716/g.66234 Transcript_31716/m.66234 type:complete len:296 (-) Transcript_31716:69-956(-)
MEEMKLTSTNQIHSKNNMILKHLFVDILIFVVVTIGLAKFCTSSQSPSSPPNNNTENSSLPPVADVNTLLEEKQIELNWERQHVFELQEILNKTNASQRNLVKLSAQMANKLKEMELKLAYEENALLEAQTRALRQRSAAAAAPDATEKTVSSNDAPNTSNLRRKGTLQVGDVVQIRGASTAAPWKIEKRLPDGTYEIVRATDGQKSTSVRGDVLSHYVPYQTGMEAACNVGSFDRVELVPCIVLEYFPRTRRGPLMLQGDYKVRIPGTEEYPFDEQRTFPVWKVMRKRHAVSSS